MLRFTMLRYDDDVTIPARETSVGPAGRNTSVCGVIA